MLQQVVVVLDRLKVVALRVFLVAHLLGDGLGGQRHQAEHDDQQRLEAPRLGSFLILFHSVLYLCDGRHGSLDGAVHVALGVTRCVALKLTLVDGADEAADGVAVDVELMELGGHVLAVELLSLHVESVADVAPQRAEHLVEELARIALQHQLIGLLQADGSHLVGVLALVAEEVAVLLGPLAERVGYGEEHDDQQHDRRPPACRSEEEVGPVLEDRASRLDRTDVARLLSEVVDLARIVARQHLEFEGMGTDGLVGLRLHVKIGEGDRRDRVVSLLAGHGQEIIDNVALDTVVRQSGLVRHLRVVLVKRLREVGLGLLDQFEVARSADDDAQRDRLSRLHLRFRQLARDVERSHASREVARLRG